MDIKWNLTFVSVLTLGECIAVNGTAVWIGIGTLAIVASGVGVFG